MVGILKMCPNIKVQNTLKYKYDNLLDSAYYVQSTGQNENQYLLWFRSLITSGNSPQRIFVLILISF